MTSADKFLFRDLLAQNLDCDLSTKSMLEDKDDTNFENFGPNSVRKSKTKFSRDMEFVMNGNSCTDNYNLEVTDGRHRGSDVQKSCPIR